MAWAGQQFVEQLEAANSERNAAIAARDIAAKNVASDVEGALEKEKRVTELKHLQREAVSKSQLHSFTAMVFGVDPVDVADAQIHWFLRFFILLPALAISVSSTLLAVTAYRKTDRRTPPPEAVEIDRSKTLERHIESVVDASIRRRERTSEFNVHPFVKEATNGR